MYSHLKYLKTPFCLSFAARHGPPTASNLLVTWRRRHGDARITLALGEITGLELENPISGKGVGGWGHGEGSKFPQHVVPPRSRRRQHLPERTRVSEARNETRRCFLISFPFLPVLKTSPHHTLGIFFLFFPGLRLEISEMPAWILGVAGAVNKTSPDKVVLFQLFPPLAPPS